jgi:hypothetical protein
MELESRCATIENQIKESGGKLPSSTLYTGKEVAAIEIIESFTEKITGLVTNPVIANLVMDWDEKLDGAIEKSIDMFGNEKYAITELINNMVRSSCEAGTEFYDLLNEGKLNVLFENVKVKLNFDQIFDEELD